MNVEPLLRRLFPALFRSLDARQEALTRLTEQVQESERKLRAEKHRYACLNQGIQAVHQAVHIAEQIDTCRAKKVYSSEEAAQYAALALYYMDGRLVREYKCEVCPNYHLTHSEKASGLVGKELIGQAVRRRFSVSIAEILKSRGEWEELEPQLARLADDAEMVIPSGRER